MNNYLRKPMIRRHPAIFLIATLLATLLTGCQSSVRTEEELVVVKETEHTQRSATEGDLFSQTQAPDVYQSSFSSPQITVDADAAVIVPDAPGIRTKKVTSRFFTEEDYNLFMQTLLGDTRLWTRDFDKMAASNGFTKSELEERISEAQKLKDNLGGDADYLGKGITVDEQIAKFRSLQEAAPEEPIVVEVPVIIEGRKLSQTEDLESLSAYAVAGDAQYDVLLANQTRDDWLWTSFWIEKNEHSSNYLYTGITDRSSQADFPELDNLKTAPEEIWQTAEEVLKQTGYDEEYLPCGGEYYFTYRSDRQNEEIQHIDLTGYGVHFTRVVDGIPVTYTHQDGGSVADDADSVSWPNEAMTLIYNDYGFAGFFWDCPYTVEDLSEDYVFLLPFDEIRNVFEKMILEEYEDTLEEGQTQEIIIEEVRLGYMRVKDRETLSEGTLVPVWDFFGSWTTTGGSFTQPLVFEDSYTSLFTINAMDGTVIDRDLGY